MPPAPTDLLAPAIGLGWLLLHRWAKRKVAREEQARRDRCPVCRTEHRQVSLMPDRRDDGHSEVYGYCPEHRATWQRLKSLEWDIERGNQP